MFRLTDLDAKFLKRNDDGSMNIIPDLVSADGIMFQCPKCSIGAEVFARDGRKGFCGPHYVQCWFVDKVTDDVSPKGRWIPSGSSLNDLTFITSKEHPLCSVLCTSGCHWHGFIRNGEATIDPH
jgi:hypothetical protein